MDRPLEGSLETKGELLAVLAERVNGVVRATDEFRGDMKESISSFRNEVREQFKAHDERIAELEKARNEARGGYQIGRLVWTGGVALAGALLGLAGAVAGRL